MKNSLSVLIVLMSFIGFSQNNHIIKTEDGRRVLLKADFTWEYLDLEKPATNDQGTTTKTDKVDACTLPKDFEEPKLNAKIQSQLLKGRATIKHIKAKVAKDYECTADDVLLLHVKETRKNGTYKFCANGTKVTYKRIGYNIAKKLKVF